MAEYDLTRRMTSFFDLHLLIPILEFVEKIYDQESFDETHRSMLLKTYMIDSVIESYAQDKVPNELINRRNEVLAERERLRAICDPAVVILEQNDVKELMDSARNRDGNSKVLEHVEQNYGFKVEWLDLLFKYAKCQYECGNYSAASICLYYYLSLVPQQDPNYLNALYGKLASEILNQDWNFAKEDLVKLRAYIDSNPFDSEIEFLQHRAWLLHWSLFVFFNCPKGVDDIIELFLNQQYYLNTIQILCPHLLRYLTVAVVTSKTKQKSSLKDLIKERHNYQDPITDFLSCLYINFDFDDAQQKLRECESVISNDFFITGCLDDFRESARLLIFEMFCRIHQCISLDMLASQTERWIVNLIRTYRIEGAKLDTQLGQVVMGAKPVSNHEQVIEKQFECSVKSYEILVEKLDKMLQDEDSGIEN